MGWFGAIFNPNKAEATRESMRFSYNKHKRLRESGQGPAGDTSPHHIGLYGALASRYKALGLPTSELVLWGELSPFLCMNEQESVEALAEYVVYKERPHEARAEWILDRINQALRDTTRTEDSPRMFAIMGYINQVAWIHMLSEELKQEFEKRMEEMFKILPGSDAE